jgi:hypothetical protein
LGSLVDSTINAERELIHVRRGLLGIKWSRKYSAREIAAINVRRTFRGNGIVLRPISGRLKNLTWSVHFQSLDREVACVRSVIGNQRA